MTLKSFTCWRIFCFPHFLLEPRLSKAGTTLPMPEGIVLWLCTFWMGVIPFTVFLLLLDKMNIKNLGHSFCFRFSTLLIPSIRPNNWNVCGECTRHIIACREVRWGNRESFSSLYLRKKRAKPLRNSSVRHGEQKYGYQEGRRAWKGLGDLRLAYMHYYV